VKKENLSSDQEKKGYEEMNTWIKTSKLVPKPQLHDVNKVKDLAETLQQLIRLELRFRLFRDGQMLPPKEKEARPVRSVNQDDWFQLKPVGYQLAAPADSEPRQWIHLEPGDLLRVGLTLRSDRFQRLTVAEEYPLSPQSTKNKSGPDTGWQLALLHSRLVENRSVRMHAALENLKERDGDEVKNLKPRDVWFAFDPPRALRWEYVPGFVGPVYRIEAAEAPAPETAADLHVWWSPKDTEGTAFEGDLSTTLKPRTVQVEGLKVTIESILVEEREVVEDPFAPEKKVRVPCLVVRLSCPKGEPVWAQLHGGVDVAPRGYEHHIYSAAGKYTGVFWFGRQSKEEVERSLSRLKLSFVSLNRFKENADKDRHIRLEIKALNTGGSEPVPLRLRPEKSE
jgi:hypothetical protein